MPWTLNDYPSSLKNLPHSAKKKVIDIANTLTDEGYGEDRAIPIATKQAEEWYANASEDERKKYEERGEPKQNKTEYPSRPELLDKDELVLPQGDQWAVQPKTAKKTSKLFTVKQEAIDYGKAIAKNKETQLHVYLKDNTKENTFDYRKK